MLAYVVRRMGGAPERNCYERSRQIAFKAVSAPVASYCVMRCFVLRDAFSIFNLSDKTKGRCSQHMPRLKNFTRRTAVKVHMNQNMINL
jgi:hypothetical protein